MRDPRHPPKCEGELLESKALVSAGVYMSLGQHAAGGRHRGGSNATAAHVVGCPR